MNVSWIASSAAARSPSKRDTPSIDDGAVHSIERGQSVLGHGTAPMNNPRPRQVAQEIVRPRYIV